MLLTVPLASIDATINADRDILLTPNRALLQPGKTAYFRAPAALRQQRSHTAGNERRQDDGGSPTGTPAAAAAAVPWEEPLKHAIYLVLNNKVDDDVDVDVASRDDDGDRTRFENVY